MPFQISSMPVQIRLMLTTEIIHYDLPDCLGTQGSASPRSSSSTLTELPVHSCFGAREGKGISCHAAESRINVLGLGAPIQCRLKVRLNPPFEMYGRCIDIDIELVLRRSLRLNTISLKSPSQETAEYFPLSPMNADAEEVCQGDMSQKWG